LTVSFFLAQGVGMLSVVIIFVLANLFPSLHLLMAHKSGFPFEKSSIKVFSLLTGIGILIGIFSLFGEYSMGTSTQLLVGWIIFSNAAFYSVVLTDPINNNSYLHHFGKDFIKNCISFGAWLAIPLGLVIAIAIEAQLFMPEYKEVLMFSGLVVFIVFDLLSRRGRIPRTGGA